MTLAPADLGLYALALFVLFLTPGPVWVALSARALSGGFRAAWPLALGVVVGDALWPFLAVIGASWIATALPEVMAALRLVAALIFVAMGVALIRRAGAGLATDPRLTRPGMLAGFTAGVAVILGNPKAILFYMGVLPGFFDLTRVTAADMGLIVAISMAVPLAGNLAFALLLDRIRGALRQPRTIARVNRGAGAMLIAVGGAIAVG